MARFSTSRVWSDSRTFYETAGIAAWTENVVPSRICNNASTAEAYVALVRAFLADVGADVTQPVPVIELGAATGELAHLFLAKLDAHDRALEVAGPPLRYVLTDVVASTLAGWSEHPRLRDRLRSGEMDAAWFDVLADEPLVLLGSGEAVSRETTAAPVVVIANYLFDALPADVFRIQGDSIEDGNGVLREPLVRTAREQRAPIDFEFTAAPRPCYGEPALERLLDHYAARFTDTSFTLPVAGIRCLGRLAQLTRGPILIIAADKGYVDEAGLEPIKVPAVIQHGGAISMTVNFHALAEVVMAQGGVALQTTGRTAELQTAAYGLGLRGPLPRTRQAFHASFQQQAPFDRFPLLERLAAGQLDVALAIGVIRTASGDPAVFHAMSEALRGALGDADPAQRRCLAELLEETRRLVFPLPGGDDVAFQVGVCLAEIGYPEQALEALDDSMRSHPPTAAVWFAVAICHVLRHDPPAAVEALDEVLAVDPDHAQARAWRTKLS